MEIFQKSVIIIAIIVLVIFLFIIGLMLRKTATTQVWPPETPNCPDYWIDLSGNGSKCFNSKNLGTCLTSASTTMDFTQSPYIGSNGNCAKYTWANGCGITWDGITTGVANPCDTTPTP